MQFAQIVAGEIVGHETKVDGRKGLVVEGPGGVVFGTYSARPNAERTSRRDPKSDGTVLEALGGSWFLPEDGAQPRTVLDADGKQIATVERTSRSSRLYHLPAGDLTWEHHTGRPQYRIDGLFGASRSALHSFAAGVSNHPFKGEITDALATRPDAALVLLLACWSTMGIINLKVATA